MAAMAWCKLTESFEGEEIWHKIEQISWSFDKTKTNRKSETLTCHKVAAPMTPCVLVFAFALAFILPKLISQNFILLVYLAI